MSKVMDVSKPGQTAPDASGKPVIVGHRPMVEDPMVSQKDKDSGETIEVKKVSRPLAQTGKKLEPISEDMKSSKSKPKDETKDETKPAEDENKTLEKDKEPESSTEKPVEKAEAEPTAPTEDKPEPPAEPSSDKPNKEQQAAKDAEAEVEHQAKLAELVESKKYFVKIEGGNTASFKSFFLTLFIILLVGAAALTLLVDAEILDLGIGLPFNLL